MIAMSPGSSEKASITIIGAGIVGLATAYQLSKLHPEYSILILEKETSFAMHQTGRNSGVIHSGIYYKPGSLKAVNCREGKKNLERFCQEEGVPFDLCGKVIVATDDSEKSRLQALFDRGRQNGVRCRKIAKEELREIEPHARGIEAMHVLETGIVDYTAVCKKITDRLAGTGHRIAYEQQVQSINKRSDEIVIESQNKEYKSHYLINCAGLHSDRISRLCNIPTEDMIIPFRGEYYQLKPVVNHLCKNLIYPVPDPDFPFLGVHFTRRIQGGVECGPNAVLALAREAYKKTDFKIHDIHEMAAFPGFWRMAAKYWKMGMGEYWRSFNKAAFVRALQKLVPEIRSEDLIPIESGIRAQAVSRQGKMIDDFRILDDNRIFNVLNAPSPAATASFNIGLNIAKMLEKNLMNKPLLFL
jgi:(S)-2-hydroxyglutarate dehydrogenase